MRSGTTARVVATLPGGGNDAFAYYLYLARNTASPALALDCAGHLYAADDQYVYAFITDSQGLKNTPWPKAHRDSRNTGNAADGGTYVWGVRLPDGGCWN